MIARAIYWVSGFVFLGGVGVAIFSTATDIGLGLVGAGLGMWVFAKVLAFIATILFGRLDEAEQDVIDPFREMRGYDDMWGL